MPNKPDRIYEFGPFRVNATERLLHRGDETIPLTPKVFDTLLILIENRGHVLTKNELMQWLWPNSFVEESSLTQNISLLRHALGAAVNGRPYIETLPKRGYRFIAEVSEHEVENVLSISAPERKSDRHVAAQGSKITARRAIAVAVGLFVVSSLAYVYVRNRGNAGTLVPNAVAVLPFKIIGEQDDTEQLGLGMADALVIRLSKLEKPVVLPTSSVARYAAGDRDALSTGKELGVDDVITGTLQREGDQVRVSAQLVRLSDSKTIWSGTFDESYHGNFALQDSISDQIAEALISCPAQLNSVTERKVIGHSAVNAAL